MLRNSSLSPAVFLLLLLAPSFLRAQQRPPHLPSGFGVGLSIEHLVHPSADLNLGTIRLSDFHPGGVGYEASASFFEGGIAFADMDIMQNAPIGSTLALIRAGVGFGLSAVELNGGLGVVLPVTDGLALRGDVTARAFAVDFPDYALITVGIGVLYIPTVETGT